MTTASTDDAANVESRLSFWSFEGTVVITMNRQTSGMATGAGQPVKL